MWPSPLLRLTATAMVTLALAAIGLGLWMASGAQLARTQAAQQQRLRAAAVCVREHLPETLAATEIPPLQATLDRLADELECTIAVARLDGEVVAQAEPGVRGNRSGSEDGKSLSHLPEVVKAVRYGSGYLGDKAAADRREAASLALRVDRDAVPAALIRVAAPFPPAASATRQGIAPFLPAAAALAASAWWLARLVTHRVTRPLEALAGGVQKIAEGRYDWRIAAPEQAELRSFAQSLDRMNQAVRGREALLRENLERRATVLSGMLEGVVALDSSERILFANPAAGKLLGFTPVEIEQRTLLEAVRNHPLREAVRQVLSEAQPHRTEIQLLGPPPRELEVHVMPLRGNPCPGVILVIDDLTHVRRLEGARQQFISNVSHELKTPLSSIKAYAETLLNGAMNDPEHRERFLGRIAEQAERLHQLILDMLSLARIEAGQASLELRDVDLGEAVRRSLAAHEPLAAAKQVELDDQTVNFPSRLCADEEALREILDNLIDNAVKYTPAGGRVAVRAFAEGTVARIDVCDTGIGIPAEHLERLFERFYRVDRARSRELGGTGLGLSIVKHLAQSMGGKVEVSSTPGKGSIFSLRLPLADARRPLHAKS